MDTMDTKSQSALFWSSENNFGPLLDVVNGGKLGRYDTTVLKILRRDMVTNVVISVYNENVIVRIYRLCQLQGEKNSINTVVSYKGSRPF
jgi:hypothetical protein